MSPPTIIGITPSSGPTAGGLLVEILGAGFELTAQPQATGPGVPPLPRVVVLVGARTARNVRVVADDRLTCVVPAGDAGPADVVVQNLDATGIPIPSEQAIAPGAFTYVRQALAVEADLTRPVRVVLQKLKRQVLENVVLTVHTDYDAGVGAELHLAQIAQLPALVLLGPELTENRFFSLNQLPEVATGPGQFAQRRVPYTVDLGFTVIGVSDHTTVGAPDHRDGCTGKPRAARWRECAGDPDPLRRHLDEHAGEQRASAWHRTDRSVTEQRPLSYSRAGNEPIGRSVMLAR